MSDDHRQSWEEQFARPRRHLSAEVERETARLLSVCVKAGVGAVVADVTSRPELLVPLADACWAAGLTLAAQYLWYLTLPYD